MASGWVPGAELTDEQRTWVELLFPAKGGRLDWLLTHAFWVENGRVTKRAARRIEAGEVWVERT